MRWKCELERAIALAAEEISFMEEQRRRLKQAAAVLQMPESIGTTCKLQNLSEYKTVSTAGECLDRRTGRLDSELVRDDVEEELIKEVALCSEIRDIFSRTLKDVEMQLLEDHTAKQRYKTNLLEYFAKRGLFVWALDWSTTGAINESPTKSTLLTLRSTPAPPF